MRWLILPACLLAGCATTIPVPKTVDVPVPVYCSPRVPVIPVLPIDAITSHSTDAEVARAWVDSVILLRGDDQSLRILLRSCNHH